MIKFDVLKDGINLLVVVNLDGKWTPILTEGLEWEIRKLTNLPGKVWEATTQGKNKEFLFWAALRAVEDTNQVTLTAELTYVGERFAHSPIKWVVYPFDNNGKIIPTDSYGNYPESLIPLDGSADVQKLLLSGDKDIPIYQDRDDIIPVPTGISVPPIKVGSLPPLALSPYQTGDQPDFRTLGFLHFWNKDSLSIEHYRWLLREAARPTHFEKYFLAPPMYEGRSSRVAKLHRTGAPIYPWDYEHLAATHLACGAVLTRDPWLLRESEHRAEILLAEYSEAARLGKLSPPSRGLGRLAHTTALLRWAARHNPMRNDDLIDRLHKMGFDILNYADLVVEPMGEKGILSYSPYHSGWKSRTGWTYNWRPWEDAIACMGLYLLSKELDVQVSENIFKVAVDILEYGISRENDKFVGAYVANGENPQERIDAGDGITKWCGWVTLSHLLDEATERNLLSSEISSKAIDIRAWILKDPMNIELVL